MRCCKYKAPPANVNRTFSRGVRRRTGWLVRRAACATSMKRAMVKAITCSKTVRQRLLSAGKGMMKGLSGEAKDATDATAKTGETEAV